MSPATALNEKRRIALTSVLAAVFLTGFKLSVGLWTDSLGILSEAAHSGLDLAAAVITMLAVTYADRPADAEHQYGHGKLENVSAFVETLLLVVTCAWIIWEAVDRLVAGGSHVRANVWGFLVMGTSIAVDISRSRALYRVARKHHSQALEADALHFSSDVWTSLTVIVGLVFVRIGRPEFDAIAAIFVALLVLVVSYRLGRRTIDALMDRVPKGMLKRMEDAVRSVEGVEELRNLRIRPMGAKLFIDATVAIRRTLPFLGAHSIMDAVEKAVRSVHEDCDVVVHSEPVQSADESVVDKIRMIVLENGLREPHNLEVHLIDGRYHIGFDVEYLKGKSFTDAHDIASSLEHRIKELLPSIGKVTIHMEEYHPHERELSDVTGTELQLAEAIRGVAGGHREVAGCRDLTLLRDGARYNVTMTCRIVRTRTLDDVHRIISEIETLLYQQFEQLQRITIHAEPD